MLFKELRQGDVLYMFDSKKIELKMENVISVSPPHPDANNLARMVVDVSLTNSPAFQFLSNESVGCAGDLTVSTDKTCILREVEAQKSNREMLIAKSDTMKEQIPILDAIIEQLSPERQEKKQTEERMAKLEDGIASLKGMVELLIKQKNGANG